MADPEDIVRTYTEADIVPADLPDPDTVRTARTTRTGRRSERTPDKADTAGGPAWIRKRTRRHEQTTHHEYPNKEQLKCNF